MRRKRDLWIRRFILAVGTIITLLFLGLDPLVRSAVKRDQKGATPQQGIATVATLVTPSAADMDHPVMGQVTVRFRGGIYSPREIVGIDRLHIAQPARITYRVGKSGRIYVDRVAPLGKG
jgi:hypothetical protein